MIFKTYQWSILVKVALMLATITGTAYCIAFKQQNYLLILIPVIVYQVYDFFKFHQKAQAEVEQFAESVHYRDFTRHFDEKHAPMELQSLRKGFNKVNQTFKLISREKETQFIYLQQILELVDTGILSYDISDGTVMWMNESLKKLTGIPYLKTIHSLEKRSEEIYHTCSDLKQGESKVVTLATPRGPQKVVLAATAFQTEGKTYKLIAFQNVDTALDETEANAWQKLLSVMTHEIMNSVAPISSLADTLKRRLHESAADGNNPTATYEDLEIGIDTIKRRSEGLLKFTEVYRNLNKIQNPTLSKVFVRDLFENMNRLLQPTLDEKGIELDVIIKEPAIQFFIDPNLTEQVLINLLLNAIDAVKGKEKPRIILSASRDGHEQLIEVADNGHGIDETIIDKIFVPFFSSKKNGTGIGLSLCRQIMLLHKGNVQVESKPGEGTRFTLRFPATIPN
jgi:nitrogen fixation/metabolism regulation signal transduction histidine kinase